MDNSGLQRLIPIALVLIIIIVAVAAVVSVGRSIFGGGGSDEPTVNVGQEALLNTAIDRSVRMTVRGPIVADEKFHSYTITVSPTTRNLTTFEGYLDRVVEKKELANSTRAYEQFVHALDREELMKGDALTGEANDTRGICPTARLIEFEVRQASNVVKKLWTTTCQGTKGSLDANASRLQRLFQAQVPDAAEVTRKVRL